MRIGLLASGNLGYSALKHIISKEQLIFVLTNVDSKEIVKYCKESNLPVYIGNPRNTRIKEFLFDIEIDVLISVNYLFLIDENLIQLPKKLAFNIHGSLLPKYRGRTPHVWAIINNEKVTGVTAHVIDSGCDTGDIIEQIEVPINNNDTGADILNKYQRLYIPLIDSVLDKVKNQSLKITPQDSSKASFFGKRSPEDGQINWGWQRERIYNWIRAQANPYPGAFTFYNDEKVVIDEIILIDYSFDYTMPNGLILSVHPLRVKTPNGAIEIKKKRSELYNVQEGEIFK